MELERGRVVRSLAGHDKGGFFTVLSVDASTAVICDEKRRPLERPKRKNPRHVAETPFTAEEASMATNRELRRTLAAAKMKAASPDA